MTPPIELVDVSKTYGPTRALDGVNLRFQPGSVTALLGPNGSGKTTLFRILLGLTRPDEGTVAVPDRSVGCAFQDPQFYAGLTVRENLDLFATLTDAPGEWVATLEDRCGLERVTHRRAGDVSAGIAKRLDLAIALVDRPDVALVDEPLADVDDDHRSALIELLETYADDERILVVATHRFDALASLVDDVVVLEDGRVVDRRDDVEDRGDGLRAVYDGAVGRE